VDDHVVRMEVESLRLLDMMQGNREDI
jgi:hypothetical protein